MKQGKLLYHGILTVSDYAGSTPILGKNKDFHVFFFEQRIIFSEVVGKKTQFTSPQFYCKADIQVSSIIYIFILTINLKFNRFKNLVR